MPLLSDLFDLMDCMPPAPKRRGKKSNYFSDVLDCVNGGPLPEDKYKKKSQQRKLSNGGKDARELLHFFNGAGEEIEKVDANKKLKRKLKRWYCALEGKLVRRPIQDR